jgi:hypothetical protein
MSGAMTVEPLPASVSVGMMSVSFPSLFSDLAATTAIAASSAAPTAPSPMMSPLPPP